MRGKSGSFKIFWSFVTFQKLCHALSVDVLNVLAPTSALQLVWLVHHFSGGLCHLGYGFCARQTMSVRFQKVCWIPELWKSLFSDVKFICRSCRYNNCIKAGMRRDCKSSESWSLKHFLLPVVQQKRDNSRVPKYVLESRREGIREVVRGYTTSSYSSVSKSSSPQSSTPSPSPSDSPETDKLSKILNIGDLELLEFYVKQVAVGKMKKVSDSGILLYSEFPIQNPLNISSASDLLGIAISNQDLALKFCTDCPGADLLDQEDVEVLFRHYSFSMIWMDSIWAAASEESCSTLDGEEEWVQ